MELRPQQNYCRVPPAHLMNINLHQMAADPKKANQLGPKSIYK